MPDKTNIELIFRTTTRSGLLLYIGEGQVSMLLEQHYGQVSNQLLDFKQRPSYTKVMAEFILETKNSCKTNRPISIY